MTKRLLNEKVYWKMSYNKRVTVENKIRAQSLIRGRRELAENRVIWIGLKRFWVQLFFGGIFREGEHT
jgi:hypothetical protein